MGAYNNFTVDTDADGIALVTWDMKDKSMNVFTMEVMDEFDKLIDDVTADAAVKGVVFTSEKSSFSGGPCLTMQKWFFALIDRERAKDLAKLAELLFDGSGRIGRMF